MKNKLREPVILSLMAAVELAEPHDLEDVLDTLQDNAIIDDYKIFPGYVKIFPAPNHRVDLAIYFAEATDKTGKRDDTDDSGGAWPLTGLGRKSRGSR